MIIFLNWQLNNKFLQFLPCNPVSLPEQGMCNEIRLRRVILIKESQNFSKSEIWNAGRGDRDRRAPLAVASSNFGDFKSFFNVTDLDHFFYIKKIELCYRFRQVPAGLGRNRLGPNCLSNSLMKRLQTICVMLVLLLTWFMPNHSELMPTPFAMNRFIPRSTWPYMAMVR